MNPIENALPAVVNPGKLANSFFAEAQRMITFIVFGE